MTVRDKINARIDQLDDATLPELLREIEDFERRLKSDFPQEFLDTVREVQERNKDLSPEEAADLADEAITRARQTSNR